MIKGEDVDKEKIKILRERTGESMMACKKALCEFDNNLELAEEGLEVRRFELVTYGIYRGTI